MSVLVAPVGRARPVAANRQLSLWGDLQPAALAKPAERASTLQQMPRNRLRAAVGGVPVGVSTEGATGGSV